MKDEAARTWVKPSPVAEVKFAEWTAKGELRQPVYLGLRSDKRADVVREPERSRKCHSFAVVRSVASKVVNFRS